MHSFLMKISNYCQSKSQMSPKTALKIGKDHESSGVMRLKDTWPGIILCECHKLNVKCQMDAGLWCIEEEVLKCFMSQSYEMSGDVIMRVINVISWNRTKLRAPQDGSEMDCPECLSNLSTSPYFFQQFKQMQNSFNPAPLSLWNKKTNPWKFCYKFNLNSCISFEVFHYV